MSSKSATAARAGRRRVAGPRVHLLSVVNIAILVVFLGSVLTLIAVDFHYAKPATLLEVMRSEKIRAALKLSLVTSLITLCLIIVCAVPIGYALSRYRFPGRFVADMLVDLPMVLPPAVIGVSLLVLFGTGPGQWFQENVNQFALHRRGIVLCQFFVAVSYGIRASKAAFDSVEERLEDLALTLGCTRKGAFFRVALPMARRGLLAGTIMAWARAVGVYGPIIIFVGAVRMKTEVLPTSIYLELSIGHTEQAIAVALVMVFMASVALVFIHALAGRDQRWWGT
jgi:molybdate transport system permease protein